MGIIRIIITAVIAFFVFRFLQRMMTPSSLRGSGGAARGGSRKRPSSRPSDGAIDAEFEDLDEKK